MAQIAFLPLPQMGHIIPTLKLAKKLKQRGHQVSYFCIADMEEYISSQGLGFSPILTKTFPRGSLIQQAKMKLSTAEMWTDLDGAVAELGAVFHTVRPDLLLVDFVLQDLALLARKAGIACAVISTALDGYRMVFIQGVSNPADSLPALVLCPKEFDDPDVPSRPGWYHAEASIALERQEPGDFPWDRLDEGRPLIFCTLGSHWEDYKESEAFFRNVLEAMRQKPDWQLLLALGNPRLDPRDLQPVPPNVVVVNWAPQLAILEKASIMMTHGGLGTVKECIFFGVPMIVFPVSWDQPKNADRVVYHGLGVRGEIDASAEQIVRLLEQVASDPSFKMRTQAMSRIFREIEDRGAGVELIERILALPQSRRKP